MVPVRYSLSLQILPENSGKPREPQLYWNAGEGPSAGRLSMSKALCVLGIVVAAATLLVFGLDLIIRVPFQRISLTMDIGLVLCSLLVGLGSWTTLREQK
jgi:hypothetical protein